MIIVYLHYFAWNLKSMNFTHELGQTYAIVTAARGYEVTQGLT